MNFCEIEQLQTVQNFSHDDIDFYEVTYVIVNTNELITVDILGIEKELNRKDIWPIILN